MKFFVLFFLLLISLPCFSQNWHEVEGHLEQALDSTSEKAQDDLFEMLIKNAVNEVLEKQGISPLSFWEYISAKYKDQKLSSFFVEKSIILEKKRSPFNPRQHFLKLKLDINETPIEEWQKNAQKAQTRDLRVLQLKSALIHFTQIDFEKLKVADPEKVKAEVFKNFVIDLKQSYHAQIVPDGIYELDLFLGIDSLKENDEGNIFSFSLNRKVFVKNSYYGNYLFHKEMNGEKHVLEFKSLKDRDLAFEKFFSSQAKVDLDLAVKKLRQAQISTRELVLQFQFVQSYRELMDVLKLFESKGIKQNFKSHVLSYAHASSKVRFQYIGDYNWDEALLELVRGFPHVKIGF